MYQGHVTSSPQAAVSTSSVSELSHIHRGGVGKTAHSYAHKIAALQVSPFSFLYIMVVPVNFLFLLPKHRDDIKQCLIDRPCRFLPLLIFRGWMVTQSYHGMDWFFHVYSRFRVLLVLTMKVKFSCAASVGE